MVSSTTSAEFRPHGEDRDHPSQVDVAAWELAEVSPAEERTIRDTWFDMVPEDKVPTMVSSEYYAMLDLDECCTSDFEPQDPSTVHTQARSTKHRITADEATRSTALRATLWIFALQALIAFAVSFAIHAYVQPDHSHPPEVATTVRGHNSSDNHVVQLPASTIEGSWDTRATADAKEDSEPAVVVLPMP